jgi:hypothetical protein
MGGAGRSRRGPEESGRGARKRRREQKGAEGSRRGSIGNQIVISAAARRRGLVGERVVESDSSGFIYIYIGNIGNSCHLLL